MGGATSKRMSRFVVPALRRTWQGAEKCWERLFSGVITTGYVVVNSYFCQGWHVIQILLPTCIHTWIPDPLCSWDKRRRSSAESRYLNNGEMHSSALVRERTYRLIRCPGAERLPGSNLNYLGWESNYGDTLQNWRITFIICTDTITTLTNIVSVELERGSKMDDHNLGDNYGRSMNKRVRLKSLSHQLHS